MTDIAIIGAGLAGLTAATILKESANVTLFEKARGAGGRIATRRAEPFQFDHGAQYFTVRTKAFEAFLEPLIHANVIQPWHARFVEIEDRNVNHSRTWSNDYKHFVGSPCMNSMPKYLAQGLDVSTETRIKSITKHEDKCELIDENENSIGFYDWIICTAPIDQAYQLLPENTSFKALLKRYKMQACITLMLGFEEDLNLDFDAALIKGENISWVSVNSAKPGRVSNYSLVIHATNDWADQNLHKSSDELLHYLIHHASEVMNLDLNQAIHKVVHSWHFANSPKVEGDTYLLDQSLKIGVCGDWLIQGRVESAFTSGSQLANKILTSLGSA